MGPANNDITTEVPSMLEVYQDTCFLNFFNCSFCPGEFLGLIKVGVGWGMTHTAPFDSDFMLSLSVMVLINTHQRGEPPKAGREGEEKRDRNPNPPPMRC